MRLLKRTVRIGILSIGFGLAVNCFAVESDQYRLLSISDSTKLILVSQIPNKTKYILESGAAKITVDGKPAEFQALHSYTIVRVKLELRKSTKDGIDIDGTAQEIIIAGTDNPK